MSDEWSLPRPPQLADDLASKIAAQWGININEVQPPTPTTGCEVCDRRMEVETTPLAFLNMLCAEHVTAVTRHVAEQTLRPIIPIDLNDARVADLLPALASWTPALGGVYLFGPPGTGKSHQAAALVKSAWAFKRRTDGVMPRIVWRNIVTMMEDIAATFGGGPKYDLKSVRDADVLVLDDMGLADNMPFAVRKLYGVIEHRLQSRLCTIITSNRDLDDLGVYLDSPQIASRLSAMCAQVSFDGLPDRRPDLAPSLE